MQSSYQKAIEYLYGLQPRGIRLGLDRMESALHAHGNPHRGLQCVHIAGTNGKGSTARMLELILRRAGYRTGLYTSPHLHRFVERIQVHGRPVDEQVVAEGVATLRNQSDLQLTFFETATLLAFKCFARAECNVCILETGLGGRLDATNVVNPLLSMITRVAMDHEKQLGGDLASIAGEKAGIIKAGAPVVVGARNHEVLRVIRNRAEDVRSALLLLNRDFAAMAETGDRWTIELGETALPGVSLALPGIHQADNAACAAAAAWALRSRGFAVQREHLRAGLEEVQWPGRLEWIRGGLPTGADVLLDVAHNPDGCAALSGYVRSLPDTRPTVLVFGAMKDKQYGAMLDALEFPMLERIYVTPSMPRALPAAQLAARRSGAVGDSVRDALQRAASIAGPKGRVVIAGSVFVVAEARAQLKSVRGEPPLPL